MAGGQERILRRRIKSVESTKKITRAMELIAATRVVKAQERSSAARPYAESMTAVILDLVKAGAAKEHPLLQQYPDARSEAIVVITSDRGLCGAYNSTVIRLAEQQIAIVDAEIDRGAGRGIECELAANMRRLRVRASRKFRRSVPDGHLQNRAVIVRRLRFPS